MLLRGECSMQATACCTQQSSSSMQGTYTSARHKNCLHHTNIYIHTHTYKAWEEKSGDVNTLCSNQTQKCSVLMTPTHVLPCPKPTKNHVSCCMSHSTHDKSVKCMCWQPTKARQQCRRGKQGALGMLSKLGEATARKAYAGSRKVE